MSILNISDDIFKITEATCNENKSFLVYSYCTGNVPDILCPVLAVHHSNILWGKNTPASEV